MLPRLGHSFLRAFAQVLARRLMDLRDETKECATLMA